MIRFLLIAILHLLSFASLQAQTALKTYGNNSYDQFNDIKPTPDGGFIMVGYSYVNKNDIILVKTDSDGDTLWTKIVDGPGWEEARAVEVINDNYYISGTYSSGFLMKADRFGNILWLKKYKAGASTSTHITSMNMNGSNELIMAGITHSGNPAVFALSVIKTNLKGEIIWSRKFVTPINTQVDDSFISSDGSVLVTGTIYTSVNNLDLLFILRLDENGNLVWQKFYENGIEGRKSKAVLECHDGNIVVAGGGMVAKFDYQGSVLWSNNYFNGTYLNQLNDVYENCHGNLVLTGGGIFLKLSSYGSIINSQGYNSLLGTKIIKNTNGGYAIVGYAHGPRLGNSFLLLTDNNGRSCNDTITSTTKTALSLTLSIGYQFNQAQQTTIVEEQNLVIKHTLNVQDICYDSSLFELECTDLEPYYELPNVLTPNGDRLNDLYRPYPTPRFVEKVEFRVFNRWGKEVFAVDDDIYLNWNGSNKNGNQLPSGVYYYHATITYSRLVNKNPGEFKGYISLFDKTAFD